MGILIPDRDMPKCCADCLLYDERVNDCPTCLLTNKSMSYTFVLTNKKFGVRLSNCPLYEVDIDFKLFKWVVEYCKSHTYKEFAEMNRMYEERKNDPI